MVRVHFGPPLQKNLYGGLAQLGERLPCKQEVTGSIPVLSTRKWDRIKAQQSGFNSERRNKDTVEFLELKISKTEIVDLISTRYGPIAQLARAHD